MKKVFLFLNLFLLVVPMQAVRKGKPVHLGRLDYHIGKPIRGRAPMKKRCSCTLSGE